MKSKSVFTFTICSALLSVLCAGANPQAATEGANLTKGMTGGVRSVRPMDNLSKARTLRRTPAQSEAPLAPTPASFHDSTNDLYLTVGKTVLVDTQFPITRVATGLGDVAIANAVSATEIMVDGKAPGQTSLIIWDSRGGRQFFNVTVRATETTEDKVNAVRRELRMDLPGQPVNVSMSNGNLVLRGTVKNLISSARAVQIASTEGKVVNLLNVDVPGPKPQILLKVKFASLDISRSRDLGINIFNLGWGNVIGAVTTGQFAPPVISSSGGGNGFTGNGATASVSNDLNLLAYFPGIGIGSTIQALQEKGVLQVLAQPNLVTEDGKEASFLAGGQYPYPVVQGGGAGTPATVTIQFKNYGISLNFIPTLMPDNTIRLQVAPEVSALDYANEVQISGFTVPGITTRRVDTEVSLSDGESFLIGGLLDRSITQTFYKIPFLGDIPVLGKFFQSQSKTRKNTELIVIVTPEIVSPIPAGTPVPSLNYPLQFMPQASKLLHNPDTKTKANTLPAAPASMPVEELIQSMKPEKELSPISTGASGGMGGGAGMSGGAQ